MASSLRLGLRSSSAPLTRLVSPQSTTYSHSRVLLRDIRSSSSSSSSLRCTQRSSPAWLRRSYATSHAADHSKHAEGSSAGATDHDHGHGHEDHYDAPGGWLWGVRPGEKYEKEGWEGIMTWFYVVPIIVATILYVNKEDTTIQTWALEEARRRLEKEGLLAADSNK